MPSRSPSLSSEEAVRIVGEQGFGAVHAGRVGVELEWLPVSLRDRDVEPDRDRFRSLADAATPYPSGSTLSFEPGAQVELSSPPAANLGAACRAIADDARHLADSLEPDELGIVGLGLDPRPLPARVIDEPRYAAMEAYFDTEGSAGRTMMCGTAAVQINLDLGESDAVDARWRLAHAIGPTLAAAFANSPLRDGNATGWRSTRLAVWSAMDRARTAPVNGRSGNCRESWSSYALDAPVMLVRAADDRFVAQLRRISFAEWLRDGHELGYPTAEDLEYHLTTLFPPIRPRGWLELRMCDAVPDPWWRVAVAVTTALLEDPEAARLAAAATAPTAELWEAAARRGLHDTRLARSARACFAAARAALDRLEVDPDTLDAVDAYIERFVLPGRCPADELLAAWTATGALMPAADRFGTTSS